MANARSNLHLKSEFVCVKVSATCFFLIAAMANPSACKHPALPMPGNSGGRHHKGYVRGIMQNK
jgi:hypothetical protein